MSWEGRGKEGEGGEEEGEGSGRLGDGRKECDTDDVHTYTRVVGNRAACSKHV